ncbi:MAG: hypothetical protein LWW75_00865 [Chlorobiales bacterium]|nr:hypothetical protein [Chlorobiales bacterium]
MSSLRSRLSLSVVSRNVCACVWHDGFSRGTVQVMADLYLAALCRDDANGIEVHNVA